ncbi:MAG TPA: DUF2267 domain-containing protein [Thermoleophilaceae bacterium]|nr:DUF2267 domain-containing protein [Thermoleophilaceae bacterium]
MKAVSERSEASRGDAERATESTLATLGERITPEEATDLASQLPGELGVPLRRAIRYPEDFSAADFVNRVAERDGIAPNDADKRVRAVLATLGEAVSEGQLEHVLSQLPTDYLELMAGTHRA